MIIAQRGPKVKAWNSSHFKGIKANEEPLQAEESEDFPGIPELPELETVHDPETMSPPPPEPELFDTYLKKPQAETKR